MMKLIKKLFGRPSIDRELIAKNDEKEWKEVCNEHSISYSDKFNMYSMVVTDYTLGRFEEIQHRLEKKLPLDEHTYPLSWNGNHLHFKIVEMQDKSVYLYAMIYFFEFSNPPKLLLLKKIEDDPKEFLEQYGKVKRL